MKLLQSWYNPRPYPLLIPFSYIYRVVIAGRQFLYRHHLKKTTGFPIPVIIVGNLTVGGTGKTPFVIYLAQLLKTHGYQPGIVSRGYGGRAAQYPQCVDAKSDPKIVGDEAVLIVQKTNCPLAVDPNRVNAVKTLLAKTACNIIISDDGLQHYALGRNIEIVIVDNERQFGNAYCLPAGPLREPLARLKNVDFILSNGVLKNSVIASKAQQTSLFTMQVKAGEIYNLLNSNLQLTHYQNPIHAVAGIGNPAKFFSSLRKMGFFIIEHPFPDHHLYQPSDLNFGPDALIIMTEKDAVKCRSFATANFWCLPISLEVETKFNAALLNKIS